VRFEGLIPDKGMFADFSDSKLVIALKKQETQLKLLIACMLRLMSIQTPPQDVMRHVHILRVLK
jgi:hypothetical protein